MWGSARNLAKSLSNEDRPKVSVQTVPRLQSKSSTMQKANCKPYIAAAFAQVEVVHNDS